MANRIIEIICFENGCEARAGGDENDLGGSHGVEHYIDELRFQGWVISEDEEDQRFGFSDAEIMGQCPEHAQKAGD